MTQTKKDPNTPISDARYRGEEVDKIRELAILLGEQALDSPTGRRLEEVCKSVENCGVRHHLSFIAMLKALASNNAIKPIARQRIKQTADKLAGRCPKCSQLIVPREITNPDVSHATDTNCIQCKQPLSLPLRCTNDG
ncbi:MAG: hypothetical protein IT410_01080 [Candidatus Doudnabacteria bacterium]|nr:hypothetical protein [Candidatus Doudnabacteria bacterium]